jgi:dienelactone hydrolase
MKNSRIHTHYRRDDGPVAGILPLLIVFVTVCFVSVLSAQAAASECDRVWDPSLGIVTEQVDYVPKVASTKDNRRASLDNGNYIVRLSGWLYHAANPVIKDAPVLIYNHGSGRTPGEPCAIARYFVKNGFVVFVPLRRGHSARTPEPVPANWKKIESTGVYTDDYTVDCLMRRNCPSCTKASCPKGLIEVDYIRQQVADVADQIRYIKGHAAIGQKGKLADPKRIALAGHSYGGSLMVFANAELKDHNVAINISGAELSWNRNPNWKTELSAAMNKAQHRPIYFLQPANGRSLDPSEVLNGIAVARKYRSQAKIFPPAPCFKNPCDPNDGPEPQQAHTTFVRKRDQVELWAPSVIEFINRYPL